jgi:hypothetical protein
MTSFRQIEANRRNTRLSTGPVTEDGKRRSGQNAVRHGLTAETVIDALEDAEDYAAFKMAVTADYDAQSAIERELVLKLASLLWRLRRATAIESGLFKIQAQHLLEFRHGSRASSNAAKHYRQHVQKFWRDRARFGVSVARPCSRCRASSGANLGKDLGCVDTCQIPNCSGATTNVKQRRVISRVRFRETHETSRQILRYRSNHGRGRYFRSLPFTLILAD